MRTSFSALACSRSRIAALARRRPGGLASAPAPARTIPLERGRGRHASRRANGLERRQRLGIGAQALWRRPSSAANGSPRSTAVLQRRRRDGEPGGAVARLRRRLTRKLGLTLRSRCARARRADWPRALELLAVDGALRSRASFCLSSASAAAAHRRACAPRRAMAAISSLRRATAPIRSPSALSSPSSVASGWPAPDRPPAAAASRPRLRAGRPGGEIVDASWDRPWPAPAGRRARAPAARRARRRARRARRCQRRRRESRPVQNNHARPSQHHDCRPRASGHQAADRARAATTAALQAAAAAPWTLARLASRAAGSDLPARRAAALDPVVSWFGRRVGGTVPATDGSWTSSCSWRHPCAIPVAF